MAGYSKLDCGIVDSSLWEMPHEYLRVWIAMLAKTDATGYVRVAAPAMARLCHLTREDFDRIIEVYCSPDPESRTSDHDGRRLEKVEGGWQILNYAKYREGLKQPDSSAVRMRKLREKRKCDGSTVTVTVGDAYAEAEAEADAEAEVINTYPQTPKGASDAVESSAFNRFWQEYPKKLGKGDALKAWKTGKCDQHIDAIMTSLEKHKRWHDWTKEGGRYIPHPATWLRRLGWENDLEVRGLETPGMAIGDNSEWD